MNLDELICTRKIFLFSPNVHGGPWPSWPRDTHFGGFWNIEILNDFFTYKCD